MRHVYSNFIFPPPKLTFPRSQRQSVTPQGAKDDSAVPAELLIANDCIPRDMSMIERVVPVLLYCCRAINNSSGKEGSAHVFSPHSAGEIVPQTEDCGCIQIVLRSAYRSTCRTSYYPLARHASVMLVLVHHRVFQRVSDDLPFVISLVYSPPSLVLLSWRTLCSPSECRAFCSRSRGFVTLRTSTTWARERRSSTVVGFRMSSLTDEIP